MDNYSNFSLNDTGHYAAFKTYTTIEVTILSILFCFALIGNSLVIIKLVFFGKKNPLFNKNSQNRMSFYMINLSIADICVALLSILPQIIWRYNILFWSKSNVVCKLTTFLQVKY